MNAFANPFTSASSTTLGHNGFEVSLSYLTGLPDPNVLADSATKIIFKSLLKRDDITKEKALNDFINAINADAVDLDEMVIMCWVQLYPKLSIDNSRNIRLLSHQTQSLFVSKLGKRYGKYLKDTTSTWLSGLFDSDRVVVKATSKSLLDSFKTQEKVDKLWSVFATETMDYCHHVLFEESPSSLSDERFVKSEDSEGKFLRLINTTINVFAYILSIDLDFNGDLRSSVDSILELPKFWKYLSSDDLSVKRSMFLLIKPLIMKRKDLITASIFKLISKSIFKALTLKSSINNIIYSSIVIPILESLLLLNKYDYTFWENSKKPKESFFNLIELGSCQSNASYYDYLNIVLRTSPLIESEQDCKRVLKLLYKNVTTERGIDFVNKSWECYLEQIVFFNGKWPDVAEKNFQELLILKLDSRLNDKILNLIGQTLPKLEDSSIVESINDSLINGFSSGTVEIDERKFVSSSLINNWIKILSNDQTGLTELISAATDSLELLENNTFPVLQCQVVQRFMELKLSGWDEPINAFISSTSSFFSLSHLDDILSLLVLYSKSNSYEPELVKSQLEKVIQETVASGNDNAIYLLLDSFGRLQIDISEFEPLTSHLVLLAKDYDYSSTGSLFKFLTKEITQILIERAVISNNQASFVSDVLKFNKNEKVLDYIGSNEHIMGYVWSTIDTADSNKLLGLIEANLTNQVTLKDYVESLFAYVQCADSQIGKVVSHLTVLLNSSSNKEHVLKNLQPSFIADSVKHSIGTNPNSILSVGNSLESNVYLVNSSPEDPPFDVEEARKLINVTAFLLLLNETHELINEQDHTLIVQLGTINEIISDYSFLGGKDSPQLTIVQGKLIDTIRDFTEGFSLGDFIPYLESNILDESLLSVLCEVSDNSNVSFYKARFLKVVLSHIIENESAKSFEDVNITLAKLFRNQLKFASFILASKEFLSSAKFDRMRNLAASELLGVKSKDIMTNGLAFLTLLIDLFTIDEIDSSFLPIPQQRLGMVLRTFANWLEADIAYDNEFMPIRVQLTNFFYRYLSLGIEAPSTLWEMAWNLCRDNLSMVSVEEDTDELAYFTFKLFIVFQKNPEEVEDIKELYDDFIDILLKAKTDRSTSDQASVLSEELLIRIFNKIPTKVLFKSYERFFPILESNHLQLQRLGTKILDSLIELRQQEFVIEYELQKSTLEDEEDDEDNEDGRLRAKLPNILIQHVSEKFEDFIEHEEESSVFKYLWGWLLLLDYFKDITYKIRLEYLNQLKKFELVDSFLDFAFQNVDIVNDASFLKQLEPETIRLYDIADSSSYKDVNQEQKRLIVHLVYLTFKYLGSPAQSWYLNLRDRQLKSNVEKFATKYISPMIINEELDKVNETLNSSQIAEENLTFKINRVVHEVKSTYLIDEQTMEMVIKIPQSFPLSNVIVDGPVRIGVKENQWKAWLLASQRVIVSQNGTIVEAIELFKKNVNYHFSGFEECAICYSVLHQDHSLPSKTCTTCNNKFHTNCLYRWFKTSVGSTCPLCRAPFSFRVPRSVAAQS